jgi:hypothetical protein
MRELPRISASAPTIVSCFYCDMLVLYPLGFLALCSLSKALPSLDIFPRDTNPIASPFTGASLPVHSNTSALFSLFRRQLCPLQTLLCSSGECCPSGKTCCGNVCCDSGYLCTGGTASAPCCVPVGSLTNTCGAASADANVSRLGFLLALLYLFFSVRGILLTRVSSLALY